MERILDIPTINKWRKIPNPSLELYFRLIVAQSFHNIPCDYSIHDPACIKSFCDIWNLYFKKARECNLITSKDKDNVTRRLRDVNDANFFGALGECMTCWFILEKLKLQIVTNPAGRLGKVLEFKIPFRDTDIKIEVKSPYVKENPSLTCYSMDGENLARVIDKANKQFEEGNINILFITPKIPIPLTIGTMIRAFYARPVYRLQRDNKTGNFIGPGEMIALLDGKLLNLHGRNNKPYFTRVSAVVGLQLKFLDELAADGKRKIDYDVFILHNPYAQKPAPMDIWGDYPHIYEVGGFLKWNDGCDVTVR